MKSEYFEMWLSLVERCVRDAEAAGSNPVISTKAKILSTKVDGIFLVLNTIRFQPKTVT